MIGAKNNKSGNIILDIFKALNQDEIKIFINNHFKYNNNIITDGENLKKCPEVSASGPVRTVRTDASVRTPLSDASDRTVNI